MSAALQIAAALAGGLSILLAAAEASPAQADFVGLRELERKCSLLTEGVLAIDRSVGAICISGRITKELVSEAESVIAQARSGAGRRRLKVFVSSGGGTTQEAIRLGELLGRNRFDLIVRDVCGSACANSLFLAARAKILLRGALVGWHGSGLFSSYAEYEEFWAALSPETRGKASLKNMSGAEFKQWQWEINLEWLERQKKLVGGDRPHQIMDYWRQAIRCSTIEPRVMTPSMAWRPGLADFRERFGVKRVEAESAEDFASPVLYDNSRPPAERVQALDPACVYRDLPHDGHRRSPD